MLTAYLQVYQPLGAFPAQERAHWVAYLESAVGASGQSLVAEEEREALMRALGVPVPPNSEHALVERREARVYLCPLRTELRVLQALVALRRVLPDDILEAFVSPREVERAARALNRLRREHPGSRSHIQQSSWAIPVAWFTLFEPSDRIVTPSRNGRPAQLIYTTSLVKAQNRITRALKPLVELADEPDIADAIGDLRDWLHEFDRDSLVRLDYGGLARSIPFGDLVEDHTVREVWEAILAFEEGDLERSGELYGAIIERWGELRGRESRN
jgi:hypothetical protein